MDEAREEIPHSTVTLDEKSAFCSYIGPRGLLTNQADNVTCSFTLFATSKRLFYSTLALEMTGGE
jgi:hypothetical protein